MYMPCNAPPANYICLGGSFSHYMAIVLGKQDDGHRLFRTYH
jgi:hypothetical protein